MNYSSNLSKTGFINSRKGIDDSDFPFVIPTLARNRRSPSGRVSLLAGGQAGIQSTKPTLDSRFRGNDEGFISPRTFPCWFNEKPAGNDRKYNGLQIFTKPLQINNKTNKAKVKEITP